MDERTTSSLQKKAREVQDLLFAHQIICTDYKIINYGVNLTLQHNGKQAILSLHYSTNKRRWTFKSANGWIQTDVIPLLDSSHTPSSTAPKLAVKPFRENMPPVTYFETSTYCLSILEPFQNDNVDCSIIIEQAQRDLRFLLEDKRYTSLDRETLQMLLDYSDRIDFQSAKEFLARCRNLTMN